LKDEAEKHFVQVTMTPKALGLEHPDTLISMANLASKLPREWQCQFSFGHHISICRTGKYGADEDGKRRFGVSGVRFDYRLLTGSTSLRSHFSAHVY